MKTLGDLTMGDCGRRIILAMGEYMGGYTLSGILERVEQHQEWVDVSTISDSYPRFQAGRRTTTIQVGPFTAELSAEDVCVLD